MPPILYDDPDVLYEGVGIPYEAPLPEQPQPIECWVATPANVYIAHLDRSSESPFRKFRFYLERNQPGGGSLEYHPDAAVLTDHPTLFDEGNLVFMRYRTRTVTWVIEDERAETNEANEWRVVAGRGVLQLLADRTVWPTDFDPTTADGLNPKTWTTQWLSFVDRAAGELLWDVISESNARFATQITRGTVETTGSDGITIDYRFENILEDVVVPILEAEVGTVEMDGLEFNYYISPGTDLSDSIVFEEGADLVSAKRNSSERDALTWVVGEGVGEGVFAKLAVAEGAGARRREAFLAAKEAGNVPLLQLMTDAALAENTPTVGIEASVDESRFHALTDYDFGDTIRVISASTGVDHTGQIVALYVAEEDDRVRTDFDLDIVRDDPWLRLDKEMRRTRHSLGVRNRQPQGQLVPFNFNGNGVFDSDEPAVIDFLISDRIYVTIETEALFAFSEFWSAAKTAEASGELTTDSGGGSTTVSGGGSTSGASSAASSDIVSGDGTTDSSPAFDGHDHGMPHTHPIPHTHTTPGHQHATPDHQHTTPEHDHDLEYGIFKEAMPGTHSVNVGVYERSGASWDLIVSLSGLTDDVEELDLTQYIDGPGSWRLGIQSAAAQPNNGRLAVSVSGQVIGAIRSA